jgi:hypothetical protein
MQGLEMKSFLCSPIALKLWQFSCGPAIFENRNGKKKVAFSVRKKTSPERNRDDKIFVLTLVKGMNLDKVVKVDPTL